MKTPDGYPCHQCAPRDWRNTPNMTGDYDMDATIMHRKNLSIPDRLALYLRKPRSSYHPGTAYSGVSNYHGDV
jgi:hypothetical protein